MWLSDISVIRPVFAAVISLLLIAFGIVAFNKLSLREYPNIDLPIVSIETDYPGASAKIVETKVTQLIEDRVAGVEGIKNIFSESKDGKSSITVEFKISQDINEAANDIRDRVSRILDNLPDEADPPEIQKVDATYDVIMWLNLVSTERSTLELTDYAKRYIQDRFSAIDGVARVRIGGGLDYSMRIWIDRTQLAARGLTVSDIEEALRSQNIELPAGSIESLYKNFGVRIERSYKTEEDFKNLVIKANNGYLIRLSDVARVELAAVEERTLFRGNGIPMVGIGIIKQSTANTLEVARAAKKEAEKLNLSLPEDMEIKQSYDSSVFIESSIQEVYKTLFIALGLVILVIYLFLGSIRAMLIPAITLPVSLIATFLGLYIFGFSINLLTLLALVLAIGLVVDDGIVVLENIYSRLEKGETPLVAAYKGARQVGFAVIATTLVLLAVFVPIVFLEGDIGRLFTEFALTIATAVTFSSLVALSLSPMLSSKLLTPASRENFLTRFIYNFFNAVSNIYQASLRFCLQQSWLLVIIFIALIITAYYLFKQVPNEFAPKEDRGVFFVMVQGPEGASFKYMQEYMDEIEKRLTPLVESGEVKRLLVRAPRGFGNIEVFNSGFVILVLEDWNNRRSAWVIMDDVRKRLNDLTGVRAFPVMRQGLGGGTNKPVQFVIGGSSYEELSEWRDIILEKAIENKKLLGLDADYKETKPQILISIDKNRAGDLGISIQNISKTLETMLGSRRVTTYVMDGEEYDVILEGEKEVQRTPQDLTHIYVRSETTGALIPLANVVTFTEISDANSLNRYNRVRAITLEANLAPGYSLGEALTYLNNLVKENLPPEAKVDYKNESLKYQESSNSSNFVFILALIIVFLVLAAQFESFIQPMVIMLTVPLAMAGALLGLLLMNQTINIYSQIGFIMLVGLASKNGILIVEFTNQLRDEGIAFKEAILQASTQRLRPILMTSLTTVIGAVPLIVSSGAGAETRLVLGVVILSGVLAAMFFTLYIIPVAYQIFAKNTGSPNLVKQRLEKEMQS